MRIIQTRSRGHHAARFALVVCLVVTCTGASLSGSLRAAPSPTDLFAASTQLTTPPSVDQFGRSVADAGDVDGDGYDDIVVGTRTYGVHVFYGGPNPEPVADAQTVETPENVAVDITLSGSDSLGDELIFSIADSPGHGTLAGLDVASGEVTYTPDADFVGSDSFEYAVSDPYGGAGTATVDIEVINEAPSFVAPTPEGALEVEVGEEVSFVLAAEDPEDDQLAYGVAPHPDGASTDVLTGEFSWRPTPAQVGAHALTLSVDDGHNTVTREIDVNVLSAGGDDAGVDAGADPGWDGGGDVGVDAGADAGGNPDVSADAGGGAAGGAGSEGCGCSKAPAPSNGLAALLVVLGLVALRIPSQWKSRLFGP